MAYSPYGSKPPFGPPQGSRWPPNLPNRPPTDANNFPPPPYGPLPSYGSYPGAGTSPTLGPGPPGMGPPPAMGPPPGMSAPGMAPPPGVQQTNISQANRPSGLPAAFQPPPNLPNINFNAPVIRLGTAASSKPNASGSATRKDDGPIGGRPGLGSEQGPNQSRSGANREVAVLIPPTTDEILRTVFVTGLTEGVGGAPGIEKLMRSVGNLKRWDRVVGADGKECTFGFAQFDDADSLAVAVEVLKDINVPVKKQAPTETPPPMVEVDEDGRDGATADDVKPVNDFPGIEKSRLVITVDQATLSFLDSYKGSRPEGGLSPPKIEGAKAALNQAVRDLFYPPVPPKQDADGDVAMGDAAAPLGDSVEVLNIPLAQEDELADIPAEMRETVAAEIAAFRERSHKRDLERLRQEEEFEAAERIRNGLNRPSRIESPPPNSGSNIPVGPRGSVPNAPSGPRGHKGFVNGVMTNGDAVINYDDGDANVSDEVLWQRELMKKTAEEEKLFIEAERRWANREKTRTAALERQKERDAAEVEKERKNREMMNIRFREWDDDREASRKSELYYRDRSAWIRERDAVRARESGQDGADRRLEETERAREEAEREQARGLADSFLERQAVEMRQREAAAATAPQPFKLKLKMQPAKTGPKRRTVAEVEGLLEDEEDEEQVKRQLIPIKFDSAVMSEEDNQEGIRALAQEIPSDRDGLWSWEVNWDHLDETTIEDKLRPFIEKKIVEFLGVQEQLLVDVVEEHLRKKAKPQEIIEELGEALDEAEDLVRKVWRMVIFYTECEKRGLSA